MGWSSRSSWLLSKIVLFLLVLLIILILIGGIVGCVSTYLTYFGLPPIDSPLIRAIFTWAYLLRVYVDSNLMVIGVVCISLPIILLMFFAFRYLWMIKRTISRENEVVEN